MTIRLSCPSCKTTLLFPDDKAAMRITCPGCSAPLSVPNAAPERTEDIQQALGKKASVPIWVWLLGAGVLSLFVCCGGFVVVALAIRGTHLKPQTAKASAVAASESIQIKTFSRNAFSFDYPATWTVDDKDKDYDPDHMFSIDASKGAMIMFVISDQMLGSAATLETHAKQHEKNMISPSKNNFGRWGKHYGQGVSYRGKYLGVQSTIRIFVFILMGRTFVITELTPDDEKAQLEPGFRIIRDSFKVQ